jgi:hypothetical protein
MPYATIDEILSRVDRSNPCPPGQFPNFDPEDLKAWAYFIHVYLDFSQGAGWFVSWNKRREMEWPAFLPRYNEGSRRVDEPPPLGRLSHLEELREILGYISYCMEVWRIKPPMSTKILGFSIDSDDDYNGCFQRAKEARDVGWEKAMSYSARELYPYADPWERGAGRPNPVASGDRDEEGNDIAYILPDIALLYLESNREWQQVFGDIGSGRIEIQAGYRTPDWHREIYRRIRGLEEPPDLENIPQSAHLAGAAIDVLPPQTFINAVGLNICIGYPCWLFRQVAWHSPTFGRVTLSDGRTVDVVPYTIFENNQTCHVSFAWLLYAQYLEAVRRDVLAEIVRPYGGDVTTSNRAEFRGPGQLSPLWDDFDADNMNLDRLGGSAGITAWWLARYIEHRINVVEEQNRRTGGNDRAFNGIVDRSHIQLLENQRDRLG